MREQVKDFKNGIQSEAIEHEGFRFPIYDGNGRQIIGQENIKREVEKRTEKWIAEHGSEPLSRFNIRDVILNTSGDAKISFRGDNIEKILNIPDYSEIENSSQNQAQTPHRITEITDGMAGVESMKVANSENSPTEANLLTDDQISKANKDELKDLIKRIKTELERRKSEQSSSNFQTNSKKLETQLHKAEVVLNSLQTPNNSSPKPDNIVPIIGVVSVVSLFGGLII